MGGRRVKTVKADTSSKASAKGGKKLSGAKSASRQRRGSTRSVGGRAAKPVALEQEAGSRKQEKAKAPKKASKKAAKEDKKVKKARKAGLKERGKKYKEKKKQIKEGKLYPLSEAVSLVKETSYAKFDASMEVHINLGLGGGKSEKQIRTTLTLPHGTGKSTRVLVFASGKAVKEAEKAGADKIDDGELIGKIAQSGKVDFDAVIATPEFMPKLAKLGRILGPQGLMPSPKAGTVTDKPARIVEQIKKGRVELRTKDQPVIHAVIGKVSFPDKKLIENFNALLEELNRVKPSGVKGQYIRSIFLTSTMGPSVKLDISSTI
jgi:large subunit ribosomal protein L1